MSTRYVWGRFTVNRIKSKTLSRGSVSTGDMGQNDTLYFAMCDESDTSSDEWASTTYDIETCEGGSYTQIPRNKLISAIYKNSPPSGKVYFQHLCDDARVNATEKLDYSSPDDYWFWQVWEDGNGYRLTYNSQKGTANGTVSNASSGAYQLDTSVDSLL